MTTYTGPTPYDDEIIALQRPGTVDPPGRGPSGYTYFELSCIAEGYRRAMQDCAPLLGALKNLVLLVENHHNATLMAHAHTGPPDNSPCELHLGVAKQAIAQAEGREQPASSHP